MSHVLSPAILREYDIRGIVGQTLHEADAFAIGRGNAVPAVGDEQHRRARRPGGRRIAGGRRPCHEGAAPDFARHISFGFELGEVFLEGRSHPKRPVT